MFKDELLAAIYESGAENADILAEMVENAGTIQELQEIEELINESSYDGEELVKTDAEKLTEKYTREILKKFPKMNIVTAQKTAAIIQPAELDTIKSDGEKSSKLFDKAITLVKDHKGPMAAVTAGGVAIGVGVGCLLKLRSRDPKVVEIKNSAKALNDEIKQLKAAAASGGITEAKCKVQLIALHSKAEALRKKAMELGLKNADKLVKESHDYVGDLVVRIYESGVENPDEWAAMVLEAESPDELDVIENALAISESVEGTDLERPRPSKTDIKLMIYESVSSGEIDEDQRDALLSMLE